MAPTPDPRLPTHTQDLAAGVLIIREAGGMVTGLDGQPHQLTTRTLIASNKEAHGKLAEVLAEAKVVGLDEPEL